VRGEFGPSPLIMMALTVGTLWPALMILAIRQVWPQLWVNVSIVTLATAGAAVSVWFFRRAVAELSSNLWQIDQVRLRSPVGSFVGLYVVPCTVTMACRPPDRWAAIAALVVIGVVAARSGSVLTNNPLMVLLGLHTHEVQLHRPDAAAEHAQTVTGLLRRGSTPEPGDLVRLINIGQGVYVEPGKEQAAV
jgi:hypothetical protein